MTPSPQWTHPTPGCLCVCVGCARAWVGGIVRTAPWVVVAHSNLFSLGGATSGECFAAGERVLGSPTTCLLLPLYIRFYRLAAPCRVVSLPRGFSYVLLVSLSVVGALVVLFSSASIRSGVEYYPLGVEYYPQTGRASISRPVLEFPTILTFAATEWSRGHPNRAPTVFKCAWSRETCDWPAARVTGIGWGTALSSCFLQNQPDFSAFYSV